MFVKFSCDCVGLVGIQGVPEGRHIIVHPCDLSGEECWTPLGLSHRDMRDKSYVPLPAEEAAELITEMGRLMAQGYQLRQVRSLLAP